MLYIIDSMKLLISFMWEKKWYDKENLDFINNNLLANEKQLRSNLHWSDYI